MMVAWHKKMSTLGFGMSKMAVKKIYQANDIPDKSYASVIAMVIGFVGAVATKPTIHENIPLLPEYILRYK